MCDCHRIYCHETQKMLHAILEQASIKISPKLHKKYRQYSGKINFPSLEYDCHGNIFMKLTTVQQHYLKNSHKELH